MPSATRNAANTVPAPRAHGGSVVALCCATIFIVAVESQELPTVAPGQAVSIVVPVPRADGSRPAAIRIDPAFGVTVDDPSILTLPDADHMTLSATVPETANPGFLSAATVTFVYPNGDRVALDCNVQVRAPDESPRMLETAAERGEQVAAPVETAATVDADVAQQHPNTLSGVVYLGATELGMRGRSEADLGMGIDLSGRVNGSTQVNALYIRGWNAGVSPVFRYGMHRSRGHLRVKAPQFWLEAGEIRPETLLTGIRAPVDGVAFQKTRGQIVGSVVAGKPKYFGGGWGGHLFQGSLGLAFRNGAVGLFASQLARPVRSSTVVANPPPEEESELIVEELEQVGRLLSRENRARTGGLEARLRFGNHQVVARGGWVELVNGSNQRISGAAGSGIYSFTTNRASITTQVRSMPELLPGLSLSGDLVTTNAKYKLVPSLAVVGRTYWNESSLLGRSTPTRGRGAAAGLEYSKNATRIHVEGQYRESQFLSTAITRSITAGLRLPLAAAAGVDGAVEYGEAQAGPTRRRIAAYRGSVYVEGERASLMLSGSYRDYGLSSPRLSADLSGSVSWRSTTLEGGAGLSRAGIFGDVTSAWTTVEFPVPGDLTIMLGADYDRWSFENSPYLIFMTDDEDLTPPWRFTFSVRRKLSVPLPFLK